ncbi:hypothetical protein DUNSADRAFT_1625 [Dunaliella salina]|uniref:NADH dehydrogenase subunit 4L n=1 Tax=Dunaliella salina TaxID=3046 RepID=A0ABQ7H8L4_DUNSA|nr:hypothetical protein DUNSADRAFT_1625 [Dunaliella salina]|eukprot:KAF5843198.1 hypothetical protein DUNSADRAFT_1625 [Dunaliella salina]
MKLFGCLCFECLCFGCLCFACACIVLGVSAWIASALCVYEFFGVSLLWLPLLCLCMHCFGGLSLDCFCFVCV